MVRDFAATENDNNNLTKIKRENHENKREKFVFTWPVSGAIIIIIHLSARNFDTDQRQTKLYCVCRC